MDKIEHMKALESWLRRLLNLSVDNLTQALMFVPRFGCVDTHIRVSRAE
jgi:hypothetical protein